MAGIYTCDKRVERDGVLIAFAGEVMTEDEALARGLIPAVIDGPVDGTDDHVDGTDEPVDGTIDVSKMKVAELEEYLEKKGITVPDGSRKSDLVTLAEEAGAQ